MNFTLSKGCNSIPLGATPVCPWSASKSGTPVRSTTTPDGKFVNPLGTDPKQWVKAARTDV